MWKAFDNILIVLGCIVFSAMGFFICFVNVDFQKNRKLAYLSLALFILTYIIIALKYGFGIASIASVGIPMALGFIVFMGSLAFVSPDWFILFVILILIFGGISTVEFEPTQRIMFWG